MRRLWNNEDCVFRKLGDGLFLQCCDEVSKLYPNLKFDSMIIDNTCMQVCAYLHVHCVMIKLKKQVN